MIIKNFNSLATNGQKKDALSIIGAGLQASMPAKTLQKIIHKDHLLIGKKKISIKKYRRVFVVAIGKAADSMAKAVNSLTLLDGGIVVILSQYASLRLPKKIKILRACHPLPDKTSVLAAKKTIEFLKGLRPSDFVLFLISGGASSLLTLPDGISLRDKQLVTDVLLKSGASIHEINCVRKHLSQIKGGKLVGHLGCDAVSLVMSDVTGDDLTTIASGITYFDSTTFSDAKRILKHYRLEKMAPKNVVKRIELGIKGLVSETPKRAKVRNYVIGSNKNCLDAMTQHARQLGFSTRVVRCVSGSVDKASEKITKMIPKGKNSCIVFGGETTVTVKGKGKGGRNQELVLYMIKNLNKRNTKHVIVSVGTDGMDGNTNAAGAIAESDTLVGEIARFLKDNDSYHFFKKHGGLVFTGPTHTNLMDIGLILRR